MRLCNSILDFFKYSILNFQHGLCNKLCKFHIGMKWKRTILANMMTVDYHIFPFSLLCEDFFI